jgi:hypothetical protein
VNSKSSKTKRKKDTEKKRKKISMGSSSSSQNSTHPHEISVLSLEEYRLLDEFAAQFQRESTLSLYEMVFKGQVLAKLLFLSSVGQSKEQLQKLLTEVVKGTSKETLFYIWKLVEENKKEDFDSVLHGFCVVLLEAAIHCKREIETSHSQEKSTAYAAKKKGEGKSDSDSWTREKKSSTNAAQAKNTTTKNGTSESKNFLHYQIPLPPVRPSSPPPPAAASSKLIEIDVVAAGMSLCDSVVAYKRSKTDIFMIIKIVQS